MEKQIAAIGGVVGVVLGGSRARGTHRPDSDHDIGIYYRGELDIAALQALADEVADEPARLTPIGGWGPWVNGGGWLRIKGEKVDWIYRDLDRVRAIWADCRAGRYEIGFQVGHPLGFYSHAYAGELALCRVLADPTGELGELREQMRVYPPALRQAMADRLWEADFMITQAGKGNDPNWTAACLFRALGVIAHARHAREGRWLISEKGMGLPPAVHDIDRVRELLDEERRSTP